MKFWLLFLLFLPTSSYGVDPSTSTFKLHSKWKQSAKYFMGSCQGFVQGGGYYCVTSDHTILNGDQDIEAWVYYSNYGVRFRLVASDWGRGLALIQFHPHEPIHGLPTLQDLKPATSQPNDPVGLWGFPYLNLKLAYLEGLGQPLQTEQRLFAQLPGVTPVTEAYVEFGMSGGGAFHAETDAFMGIISHQKVEPGTTAQTVYLVPATSVYPWLEQFFAGTLEDSISLRQSLHMQFRSYPTVGTGTLVVETIGVNGHAADFGLGRKLTESFFPSASLDLKELEKALIQFKSEFSSYRLYGFRRSGAIGGGIHQGFSGLPEAFHYLADPTLEPVFLSNRNFMDKASVPLYEAGKMLSHRVKDTCRSHYNKIPSLCAVLTKVAERLEKPFGPTDPRAWMVLRPKDPATILHSPAFADDWKRLQKAALPSTVDGLRESLKEVGQELLPFTL